MNTESTLRAIFESKASDPSFKLSRSRKGNYVNPAIARDWKWFQAGAALAAPMPQAEPEAMVCAARAVEAWDSTVLPKSNDGMMQERMEDLREVLSIWRDECEKAGGFVNANAKGLLFTESALQRIGGALESLSAPQEASKPAGLPPGYTQIAGPFPGAAPVTLPPASSKEASKVEPVADEQEVAKLRETVAGLVALIENEAPDADGEAFRKAAELGLTLRFYGGCAQSSMPGSPSVYEVVNGSDRAASMREAVNRAAIGGKAP